MAEKRNTLTRVLAAAGTVLVWLPVAAPILFTMLRLVRGAPFRFDFLMPAEGFPLVLVGAGLLIWAAARARSRVKTLSWLLGIGVALLFGGQGIAVVTGLASGAIEPEGWLFVLVIGMIAGYDLAVIGIGAAGIQLMRDLFNRSSIAAIDDNPPQDVMNERHWR